MIAPERARTHTHTHTHTSVPALLTWQHSWYFIKIKYSEPNISAPASVSPLERDWSTKPIIYIINNSLAFRYVTSQIWKYFGIFGFVPNERGRIHEHKAPFRKQLSAQAFKYTPLSVYVRDAFRISTWSLSSGLCFQVRNSWHSLFFCWRLSNNVALLRAPPSGLGGGIACIRCKASCTEPRCPYRDGSVRIHVSFHP